MYALRLSIVWIFVILGSVKCSISSIPDYGKPTITIKVDKTINCKAMRNYINCTTCQLCYPDVLQQQGYYQVATILCATDPSKPYCDKEIGVCTSVPPNQCLSNDFICPSVDGVYPDPNNGNRYHLCANGYRTTNICPPNNCYDTYSQTCKLSYSPSGCITVSCRGRDDKYFAYPTDDRIYGNCIAGRPFLIGRCKDYEKFDVNLNRCVRVCRKLENQPTEDCQKYVRCAEIKRGQYLPVMQYCACNEGFDKIKGICTKTAECLKGNNTCETKTFLTDLLGLPDNYDEDNDSEENEQDLQQSDFIITNNNNNSNNNISNGNDDVKGNIINGNSNQHNSNSGDGSNITRPGVRQFINNSGNSQGSNTVSNGNDEKNSNIVNGNDNNNNKNEDDVNNIKDNRHGIRPLIINNSGNNHGDNDVSNGNDSDNGNIVNGNGNANNKNEGDIGNIKAHRPGLRPLIINNSENSHSDNNVSNGNDNNNGNIVNGNSNDNNKNEGDIGNIEAHRPGLRPFIINNSENNHGDNDVSNGNDSNNGNIINGNGNANNKNEGDIGNIEAHRPGLRPLIINNSENSHSDNNVSNGNDNNNGNIVNGNSNDNNKNEGDIGNIEAHRPGLRPFIINNSENSHSDNNVSNGNDNNNGNIVNGNSNDNNKNEGDIGNIEAHRPGLRPFIINNSENSHSDNNVSNGNDNNNGNIVNGNSNDNNKNEGDIGNIKAHRPGLRPLIINNSENSHSDNNVSNGNDNNNGNIVNGNSNDNNKNEGDIGNIEAHRPGLRPLIINNSENSHSDNNVSNGNDNNNGNIVNGNSNDNNKNEGDIGNIEVHRPGLRPFIINNSGNNHGDNDVSNGNDSNNGNIINGNGNANNKNEGDIGNIEAHRPGLRPLIINNSENSHSDNNVSNGNDNNNGNIVNGNSNDNNKNEGDIGNVEAHRPGLRPFIINNSENSHSDNNVSNGNDSNNGNIINGNGNADNANEGNVNNRN